MHSEFVGGEMSGGSDRPATPPAALRYVSDFVAPSDRVLFAGPHPGLLLTTVGDAGAHVTCLLRSALDAAEVSERFGVDTVVGGVAEYAATGPAGFDLVIAFDGLARLSGPDSPDQAWTDAVEALRALRARTGRLLLAVHNECGLTDLVDATGPTEPLPDDQWPVSMFSATATGIGATGAPGRRPVPTLRRATGLGRVHCVYGRGRVAVAADTLTEPAELCPSEALLRLIGRAERAAYTGREVLHDPYETTLRLGRTGTLAELAPAWWVAIGPDLPDTPQIVVADDRTDQSELTVRTPLLDQLPAGMPLSDLCLTAARSQDTLVLRRLLSSYIGFVAGETEQGRLVDALADPDRILIDVDPAAVTDPGSWRLDTLPGFAPTAGHNDEGSSDNGDPVATGLVRLAARLLGAGVRSGFPPDTDVEPPSADPHASNPLRWLTRQLALAAGIDTGRADRAVATFGPPPRPAALAEAMTTIGRLTEEAADARAEAAWMARELGRARGSISFRVGSIVTAPARLPYKAAKKRFQKNTFGAKD